MLLSKHSLKDCQRFFEGCSRVSSQQRPKREKEKWERKKKRMMTRMEETNSHRPMGDGVPVTSSLTHRWEEPIFGNWYTWCRISLKKKEKKDTWHHTWDFLRIIWDPRNIPWLIPMDEMLPFLVTSIITNISGTNSTLKRDIWISHHICLLWDALRCSEIHRVRGSFGAHWRKRGCSC